jgi:outer membrane receptor protein involved in Fe transport
VFGSEWRRDTLSNRVDPLQEANMLAGQGGPTIGISGRTQVEELFFEGRVPIAQDRAGLESLSFDTAYRYSDYGDGVQTDTYKFGLEWAPIQDVRLRGSYQRAVRAANIIELFTAQGIGLFDAPGDPCGALARDPEASAAECIATGVPAAQVGSSALDDPSGQYQLLAGGNAALTPEESDTYSYGVIFTPRFAPGLAVTIDYFDIKIDNTISAFGAANTWTACYHSNDPAACDRINRNPLGQLWIGDGHIEDININIGSVSTKGYDINATYTGLELGRFGNLAFNLTGTLVDELVTDPGAGFEPFDCVGFYSTVCSANSVGVPTPEWRHRFRTTWQTPWNLDLSLTWRHLGKVVGVEGANDPFPENRIDHTLSAQDYFDLAANWAVTEKAAVTLGVNNFLDDDPPLSATVGVTGNGNTFPQTYDALGRYVFLRATLGF